MKKFYFLLVTLLIGMAAWSQTRTWNGGNGAWDVATNWTPAGIPGNNSVVLFNDGSTASITNVPAISLNRLTVTGGSNVTLRGGALTVNNFGGSDLIVSAGSALSLSTNVNITLAANASANIAGVLTVGSGRTFNTNNAGAVTTIATTGILDNRGTVTSAISTRLVFQNGATYLHARNGGGLPIATWHDNSNVEITGIVNVRPTPSTLDQEFGNFTWNSPNQNINALLDGRLDRIDGDFTMTSTGTGSISLWNLGGSNIVVNGDYIQTGGTLTMINGVGFCILELNGNFDMSGGTLNNNGPTCFFAFDKSGVQTFTKTGGSITGVVNFLVNSGSAVNFGTSIMDGAAATFRLNSGGKLITANPDGIYSAGAAGTIQVGGTREYDSNADYEFRGANTGVFNTTTNKEVRDLIINNSGGSVNLLQPMTVNRELILTNGELNTDAVNILTVVDGATASGYSSTSFVNGPMIKVGNDKFTFPVGKSGAGLRKIGIEIPAGAQNTTTSFTAEFFRSTPHALGTTLGAGLTQLSDCEYWTLDRVGTNNVRVVLSWESESPCNGSGVYVTQPTTLRVARWTGALWANEGRLSSTGNNTAGTVMSSNVVSSFGPFALASSTSAENPLPVVFANVRAYEKNSGVQIEWSNLTEKDVANYVIERSSNGSDFSSIGEQLPTSNQNDKADYSAFDAAPNAGVNYYRIKAEETTGKIVYSKVLSVNLGTAGKSLNVYPNPVKGNQLNISLSNVRRGQYDLRVINTAGQDIFKQRINTQGSTITQTIDLPSSVKPGVYNLVVTGSDYRETRMFIVQ